MRDISHITWNIVKLSSTLSLLLLLVLALPSKGQNYRTCVTTKYPITFGDDTLGGKDSSFDVVDGDENANLVIGGYTISTALCPMQSGQTMAPFVVYISSFLGFRWKKCLSMSPLDTQTPYSSVQSISFNYNGSKVVLALDKPSSLISFTIIILSSADGSITGQYYETTSSSNSGASMTQPNSLYVDSNDNIHYALKLYNRFTYFIIPLVTGATTTGLKASFIFRSDEHFSCSNAYSVLCPTPDCSAVFISGDIQTTPDNCITGMISKWSGASPHWILGKEEGDVINMDESIQLRYMDAKEDKSMTPVNPNYLWACGLVVKSGISYFYIQRIKLLDIATRALDTGTNLQRIHYSSSSSCLGVKADQADLDIAWALVFDQGAGQPFLAKINMLTDTTETTAYTFEDRFTYSDFYLSSSVFLNDKTYYMVGSLKQFLLDDLSTTQDFNSPQGFVHRDILDSSYILPQEAINPDRTPQNPAPSITKISMPIATPIFHSTSLSTYFAQMPTTEGLYMLSNTTTSVSTQVITTGAVWENSYRSAQVLLMPSNPLPLTYDVYLDKDDSTKREFQAILVGKDNTESIDPNKCFTKQFDFHCSGISLPFICNARDRKIQWPSTIAPSATPYQFSFNHRIPALPTSTSLMATRFVSLSVTNICSQTPIGEPSPLFNPPLDPYTITQPMKSYSFSAFTPPDPNCPDIKYELHFKNGGRVSATHPLFKLYPNTKQFTVGPSSANNLAKKYELKFVAIIESDPVNRLEVPFTYEVKHECYLTQITSSLLEQFYYLAGKNKVLPTYMSLYWTQTKSSLCPNFIYQQSATTTNTVFTLPSGSSTLSIDPSIIVGTYYLYIDGFVQRSPTEIYYQKQVTYQLDVKSCLTSAITKYPIDDINYNIYTSQEVNLGLHLWTEHVEGKFINECGPFQFSITYSPAGSQIGIIEVNTINSGDNAGQEVMKIQTIDLGKDGSSIDVTITGRLQAPLTVSDQAIFRINFINGCASAAINVQSPSPDYGVSLDMTKNFILPIFQSAIPLCGSWNYRVPIVKDKDANIVPTSPGGLFAWISGFLSISPMASIPAHQDQSPYMVEISAFQGSYSGQVLFPSTFRVYVFPSGTCTVQSLSPDPHDLATPPTNLMPLKDYVIGDSPLIIIVHPFIQDDPCNLPLQYAVTLENNEPLPGYIQASFPSNGGVELRVYTNVRPVSTESITKHNVVVKACLYNEGGYTLQPKGTLIIPLVISDTELSVEQGGQFVGVQQQQGGNQPQSNTTQKGGNAKPIIQQNGQGGGASQGGGPPGQGPSGQGQGKPGALGNQNGQNKPGQQPQQQGPKQQQEKEQKQVVPLQAVIKQISSNGIVKITFNQKLEQSGLFHRQLNESVLLLSLIKGRPTDSDADLIGITSWKVDTLTQTKLDIQLNFQDPKMISRISQKPDTLNITILDGQFFQSSEYLGERLREGTVITRSIPKQLSQEDSIQSLIKSSQPASTTTNSLVVSNLAINLVMASSLQYLWGMISVMQLILNMPLMNLQFPPHVIHLFTSTQGVASMNLIPMDQIRDALFKFTATQSDMQFQQMGIEGTNFIENMGSMLFYVGIYGVLLGLMGVMKFFTKKYKIMSTLYIKCAKILLFNTAIRIFIEGQLEFSINSFLNLKNLHWETTSDTICSLSALTFATAQLSFPFALWALLWSNFGSLVQSDQNERYGSSYFEIKTSSRAALLYNVLFMVRRLVYAGAAVFLDKHPPIQAFVLIASSLMHLAYIMYARPFMERTLNSMEMFNEGCILIASYHTLIFSDGIPSDNAGEIIDFQYKAGWCLIGIVSVNVLVNMSVMVYQTKMTTTQDFLPATTISQDLSIDKSFASKAKTNESIVKFLPL
ncbi:hypothetical protein FGO68_gene6265 [Halteria grandinella]|uniref:TRP C-terminal domain-containing protein n=1 Tax=Halteria grandinella TaxID=5974 RepID=A0A8J8P5D1_HALGN|nr:hypothetical protein FGO68_gene6265 [Halteria grandinella]